MILFGKLSVEHLTEILKKKVIRLNELQEQFDQNLLDDGSCSEYFSLKDDVAELRSEIYRRHRENLASQIIYKENFNLLGYNNTFKND